MDYVNFGTDRRLGNDDLGVRFDCCAKAKPTGTQSFSGDASVTTCVAEVSPSSELHVRLHSPHAVNANASQDQAREDFPVIRDEWEFPAIAPGAPPPRIGVS